ncbi:hypothetical protein [uncultured Friedmanniella sp.]
MYRPLELDELNEQLDRLPDVGEPCAPPMWQGAGITWRFKVKKVGT